MANKKTILGADVVKFDNGQDGFNPVFRKVIDFSKTPIGSSDAYAIFRLPVGFSLRTAFVYVHEDMAASGSNYDFDLDIGTAADTDSLVTVALDDIDTAGDSAAASLVAVTVASTTATIGTKVVSGTAAVYGWLKSDQAVTKGKLEIVVSGDQLLTPAKAF